MHTTVLGVVVPASVALIIAAFAWRRTRFAGIAGAIENGALGGLLGTFAYDLVRVPFHLSGKRVFAPVSAYGIWITDAAASSRFTEVAGWTYHFANGVSFGIMYALLMSERSWMWGVAWGLMLETIMLASPLAGIFSLSANYDAIAIAYAGHVAWGVPVGVLAQYHRDTREYLAKIPGMLKWSSLALAAAALVAPLFFPASIAHDKAVKRGELERDGDLLRPHWLRIRRGERIRIVNSAPDSAWIRIHEKDERIPSSQMREFQFDESGVHQVFVETTRRSRSSFVIVEPVEER